MQQKLARFADSQPGRPCLQRQLPIDNGILRPKPQTPTNFRYTLSLTHFTLTGGRVLSHSSNSPPKRPCHAGDELASADVLISLLQAAHPVLELGHTKVTQLITIFKDEVYPIFPCVRIQLGHHIVDILYSLLNRIQHEATWNLEVIDVELTKTMVAIAMLVKNDTQSTLAADLEDHLLWSVDSCYDQDLPQIEDIIMATLLVRLQALFNQPELTSALSPRPCTTTSNSDRSRRGVCLESLLSYASSSAFTERASSPTHNYAQTGLLIVDACLPVCMISTGNAVSTPAFPGPFMTERSTCLPYE